MEIFNTLFDFVLFILASNSITTAIVYGSIFKRFRTDEFKEKHPFLGEVLSCPVCLPYHIAFYLALFIFIPSFFMSGFLLYLFKTPLLIFSSVSIIHYLQEVNPPLDDDEEDEKPYEPTKDERAEEIANELVTLEKDDRNIKLHNMLHLDEELYYMVGDKLDPMIEKRMSEDYSELSEDEIVSKLKTYPTYIQKEILKRLYYSIEELSVYERIVKKLNGIVSKYDPEKELAEKYEKAKKLAEDILGMSENNRNNLLETILKEDEELYAFVAEFLNKAVTKCDSVFDIVDRLVSLEVDERSDQLEDIYYDNEDLYEKVSTELDERTNEIIKKDYKGLTSSEIAQELYKLPKDLRQQNLNYLYTKEYISSTYGFYAEINDKLNELTEGITTSDK